MKNGIYQESNKFVAYFNGEVVYTGRKQERVELEYSRYLKRNGKSSPVQKKDVQVQEQVAAKFHINKRFEFLQKTVKMVAKGVQASAVISGQGGLGKSYTVRKTLEEMGLSDASDLGDLEAGAVLNRVKTFTVVKGYSTAKGLYRTLYENKDSVIVFDDCDSVLKDPVALNLLKGALDSYDVRVISWNADMRDEDLPRSFIFNGRVVFISNMAQNKIDQAIRSRSAVIDVSMTLDEMVDRMRVMIADDEFLPQYDDQIKTDAIEFIASKKDEMKEVSLRSLITVCKVRAEDDADWMEMAEYLTCN
jgi:hypothetical protein